MFIIRTFELFALKNVVKDYAISVVVFDTIFIHR